MIHTYLVDKKKMEKWLMNTRSPYRVLTTSCFSCSTPDILADFRFCFLILHFIPIYLLQKFVDIGGIEGFIFRMSVGPSGIYVLDVKGKVS